MKALDINTVFEKLDSEKPLKGSAFIEKQIFQNAAKFIEYIEAGYSEEQIYHAFPIESLTEIDMDKKTFVRKLKTVINRYKKTLSSKPSLTATEPPEAVKPEGTSTSKTSKRDEFI